MTSAKKKNPGLSHLIAGYNERYISPFYYIFDYPELFSINWNVTDTPYV